MASPIDGHAKNFDHLAINQQPTPDMRRNDRADGCSFRGH